MLKLFWQGNSLRGCCLFSTAEEYLRMQPAPLPCGTVSNCTRCTVEAFKMHSSESRIKRGGGGDHPHLECTHLGLERRRMYEYASPRSTKTDSGIRQLIYWHARNTVTSESAAWELRIWASMFGSLQPFTHPFLLLCLSSLGDGTVQVGAAQEWFQKRSGANCKMAQGRQ